MSNPFETDLDRNAANFVPLSPLSFLERAAQIFPDRAAKMLNGLPRRQLKRSLERTTMSPHFSSSMHCERN